MLGRTLGEKWLSVYSVMLLCIDSAICSLIDEITETMTKILEATHK